MYFTPHIAFNGNCTEAIELYERAFGAKADQVVYYKDAPQEEGYELAPEAEKLVMHAALEIERGQLYLCDYPPGEKAVWGTGMGITAEFETAEQVASVFKVLAEGGSVEMEPRKVFWCSYFGSLTDKFGINWSIGTVE